MCYIVDMFFIYQCDGCDNVLRATITPVNFCRFGHIHRPGSAATATQGQESVGHQRQQRRQQECPSGFNPVPANDDVPPPTMTVKSNERCGDCQQRLDLLPDEDREMERMLLWTRWLPYIGASELGEYLSVRAGYERSE